MKKSQTSIDSLKEKILSKYENKSALMIDNKEIQDNLIKSFLLKTVDEVIDWCDTEEQ